ncbi:MAG: YegP family protein, partial [Bacteroidia bacterium]|nr:YegP family protein [Bacteroidia bacterium]
MTKFELYKGKDGQHYFRLKDEKGSVLLSSEGYKQKDSAMSGISSIKTNIVETKNYELKTSDSGKHYFNLKATNGQVIGTSTMFDSSE